MHWYRLELSETKIILKTLLRVSGKLYCWELNRSIKRCRSWFLWSLEVHTTVREINFKQIIGTQCNKCCNKLCGSSKKGNVKTPELAVGKNKTRALFLCEVGRAMHSSQRGWQVHKYNVATKQDLWGLGRKVQRGG